MRLDRIRAGAIEEFEIRLAGNEALPKGLKKGGEVRLFWSPEAQGSYLQLSGSTESFPVAGVTANLTAELGGLLRRNLPRLSWVSLTNEAQNSYVVQVHTFPKEQPLPEMVMYVDEALVSAINKSFKKRRFRNIGEVISWLSSECLLPDDIPGQTEGGATSDSRVRRGHRLLISTDIKGSDSLVESIVIHGASIRVYVKNVDGSLVVKKVSHSRASSDKVPIWLGRGIAVFDDMSIKERVAFASSLAAVTASGHGFIDLWRNYCSLEMQEALDRARKVREIPYTRWMPIDEHTMRFEVTPGAGVGEALAALREQGSQVSVEAGEKAPLELLTEGFTPEELAAAEDFGNSDKSNRPGKNEKSKPFFGDVAKIDKRFVEVTSMRGEDNENPPASGVLYVSLRSHKKQQERRDKAYDLIKSGGCAMPQLGLLIEDVDAPAARQGDYEPVTPIVRRKVFPKHGPTSRQEEAIWTALNTPDIAVIQGPPGTGKTTVINAIIERLNEIAVDSPHIAGSYLLTSYQHDAVENAMSRMRVNGLPALKFGSRSRRRDRDDRRDDEVLLEKWRKEQAAKVKEKVPGLVKGANVERELKLLRDGYMLTPSSQEDAVAVLDQAIDYIEPWVSPDQLGPARQLRNELSLRQGSGPQRNRMFEMKAVRALRYLPEAFSDDGAMSAMRVTRVCIDLIEEDERRVLDRAACWLSSDAPPFLDEIEHIRRKLLRRLATNGAAVRRRAPDARVLTVLDSLCQHVRGALDQGSDARARLIARFVEDLDGDIRGVHRAVANYTRVFAATCQQSDSVAIISAKGGDGGSAAYDTVLIDEAARANPLDLFIPMAMAKSRLILVGDHRQLPQLIDPIIEKQVMANHPVEEAENELRNDLKMSLFERLFVLLNRREERGDIRRCVTLNEQYRMHPVLGEFVNQYFYEGVDPKEKFTSPTPAEQFRHGLPEYTTLKEDEKREVAAAWKNIGADQGNEHNHNPSFSREAEAGWIAGELHRCMTSEAGADLSFGVITFYSAQTTQIIRALAEKGIYEGGDDGYELREDYRLITKKDGTVEERLSVGSVDAFQGKEFDVVFLSMVRSNDQDKFGHLSIANRLCVAMSRQRKLLVVVGDTGMLKSETAHRKIRPLVEFHRLCEEGNDGILR